MATKIWSDGRISGTALGGPVLQLRVRAQFYLESKGKYTLEAWGHADPKDKEKKGP